MLKRKSSSFVFKNQRYPIQKYEIETKMITFARVSLRNKYQQFLKLDIP